MNKYKGLFTFDVENHRYIPLEQTEGLFTKLEMDYHIEPSPLINDEEIRKIIRAWADVNDAGKLKYNYDENSLDDIYRNTITFNRGLGLEDDREYTIPELCGEEEE